MTLQEALNWIANIFEAPVEEIHPQTKRDDIEGWDSLGTLTLMAQLDEEFEILLSEDELSELKVVEDILTILKDRGILH